MDSREQIDPTFDAMIEQIFGAKYSDMPEPVALREWRLKSSPGTGRYTLAHPEAEGENIVAVGMVPASVPASEVLQLANLTAIVRKPSRLHGDERRRGEHYTRVYFAELGVGKIVR